MPEARYFDPNTDRVFRQIQQNRARLRAYQAEATPDLARSVGAVHRTFPNLTPGAVLSAGRAELDPDGPEVRALAQAQERRKEGRGFLGMIGEVVNAGTGAVASVADMHYDIFKGFSRGTFAGPQAIGELLNAGVREAVNPSGDFSLAQTTLGAGVAEIADKGIGNVDFGSGFFVGGNVKKRQVAAARAGGLTPDGKAITIGRNTAGLVFDDRSSRGYNIMSGLIDAAVSLGTDPTTYVGGAIVKPVAAARNLAGSTDVVHVGKSRQMVRDEAGIIRAQTRDTYLPEKAHDWLLKSREGERLRQYLKDETNFERLRQATKGKMPVALVAKLASLTDDDQILAALADEINTGGGIRQKFGVSRLDAWEAADDSPAFLNLGMKVRAGKRDARLWALKPGHEIDFENMDEAVEQLNRFQQNAKIGIDERGANNARLVNATTPQERYDAVRDVLGQVASKVETELEASYFNKMTKRAKGPLDPATRTSYEARARNRARDAAGIVTRAFDDTVAKSQFLGDDILRNAELQGATPVNSVVIDGTLVETPPFHLWMEALNRNFPLPDAREIRRVLTNPKMRALLEHSGTRKLENGADFFRDKIWVPFKLLRGAYTVRNLMEAQMSSAAGGYATGFYHPLQYLGYVLYNPKGREELAKTLDGANRIKKGAARAEDALAGKVTVRGQYDAFGQDFQRLSEDAQRKDSYGMALDKIGLAAFRTDDGKRILVSREYVEFDKSQNAEAFQRAWAHRLSVMANDPVAKRVVRGLYPGDKVMPGLSGDAAVKEWFWSGAGKKFRNDLLHRDEALVTREGADAYIDWLNEAARTMTGGNTELLDLLRTGRLNGKALWNGDSINTRLIRELGDYTDVAPQVVSGPKMFHAKAEMSDWDNALQIAFNALAAVPENKLSRSPLFREAYWKRIGELSEFLDEASQARALAGARNANVNKNTIAAIEAGRARRAGSLTLDAADEVAKRFGLDETRRWLYTSHDKANFFDINRNIFVFGDAWANIFKRWSRIAVQSPQVPYRVGLGVQGGRDADMDGDGKGFFFRDPTTGQERFAYPGSRPFLKAMTGVDTSFDGSLTSLNLVTQSVVPSIGPVTSVAASHVLPDEPEWDRLRGLIMPFGEPDGLGVMPPFLDKAFTAATGGFGGSRKRNEAYASTQMDVMRHLYSTGRYDLSDPADAQALLDDAKGKTSWLFYLRAAAQFVVPAAPSPNFKAQIKDGKTADIAILSTRLRELQDENFETSTLRFLDEFGDYALLMLGSKTENLGSAEPTKEAGDFARHHRDVARRFKDVYGLFVGPGGAFDSDAYTRQRDSGERVIRTPDDFLAEAEQRAAQAYYARVKDSVGPNPGAGGQELLRQAREVLQRSFTKYNPQRYDPGEVTDTVQSLQQAATDPTLADTDAGKGLTLYLQVRDAVVTEAGNRGVSGWGRANATADLRELLRRAADIITREHPDFADMFERALSREMVSDA